MLSNSRVAERGILALLLVLGLGSSGPSLASEPAPTEPSATEPSTTEPSTTDPSTTEQDPPVDPLEAALSKASAPSEDLGADEEIIVFSDMELARERQQLDQRLRQLGFQAGKRRDNRTVYRPEVAWKPTVIVYDEGFVTVKRSPVRFEPYLAGQSKLRYLACIPPFGLMCLRIGGQLVSPRKLHQQKHRVVSGMHPEVLSWREVLVRQAHQARVENDIPAMLEASWTLGLPMDGGDTILSSPADRRADILAFWSSRTCTPEGDEVSYLVALFIEYEIDASDTPTTEDERRTATAASACGRQLTGSGSPPRP